MKKDFYDTEYLYQIINEINRIINKNLANLLDFLFFVYSFKKIPKKSSK